MGFDVMCTLREDRILVVVNLVLGSMASSLFAAAGRIVLLGYGAKPC